VVRNKVIVSPLIMKDYAITCGGATKRSGCIGPRVLYVTKEVWDSAEMGDRYGKPPNPGGTI
jgi:hypothetical protein